MAAGDVPVAAALRLSAVPDRRPAREARAAPCGRYGSGRITERKGRPRAGYRRGSGPVEDKEEADQAGKVPSFSNIRVHRRRRPGDEIALNEHRGGGRTDLVPMIDLAGSLPIFGEMHDVVVRTIRCGVVDTPGDRADGFAVDNDHVLVLSGAAERDVTGTEIATGHGQSPEGMGCGGRTRGALPRA